MPDFWWILAFGSFFAIQLLLIILWPKVILPLFNKLSPLEEGELKDRLMGLSEKPVSRPKPLKSLTEAKDRGIRMPISRDSEDFGESFSTTL